MLFQVRSLILCWNFDALMLTPVSSSFYPYYHDMTHYGFILSVNDTILAVYTWYSYFHYFYMCFNVCYEY